jgi:putative ABC transport system substrate-binding protein
MCFLYRRREVITLLGGAAATTPLWPLAARAQPPERLPTIGFLNSTSPADWSANAAAFRQGLEDAGFIEGRNVALAYRWAEYRYDRLPEMARDLVRLGVNVIFASGGDNSIRAATAATSTIPIVFTSGNDPVMAHYVQSLNRPGGNVTGIVFFGSALEAKRIELLHEIDPKAVSVAVLMGAANARTEKDTREIEGAAKALGLRVRFVRAGSEDAIDPAFKDIIQHRDDALHIVTDPFFAGKARILAALAREARLPATSSERNFVAAGGLMSYGASISKAYRAAGSYAGRILKGEKPTDLPVQQPTTFELAINLKTAKTLGLNVPLTLQASADEVIE